MISTRLTGPATSLTPFASLSRCRLCPAASDVRPVRPVSVPRLQQRADYHQSPTPVSDIGPRPREPNLCYPSIGHIKTSHAKMVSIPLLTPAGARPPFGPFPYSPPFHVLSRLESHRLLLLTRVFHTIPLPSRLLASWASSTPAERRRCVRG